MSWQDDPIADQSATATLPEGDVGGDFQPAQPMPHPAAWMNDPVVAQQSQPSPIPLSSGMVGEVNQLRGYDQGGQPSATPTMGLPNPAPMVPPSPRGLTGNPNRITNAYMGRAYDDPSSLGYTPPSVTAMDTPTSQQYLKQQAAPIAAEPQDLLDEIQANLSYQQQLQEKLKGYGGAGQLSTDEARQYLQQSRKNAAGEDFLGPGPSSLIHEPGFESAVRHHVAAGRFDPAAISLMNMARDAANGHQFVPVPQDGRVTLLPPDLAQGKAAGSYNINGQVFIDKDKAAKYLSSFGSEEDGPMAPSGAEHMQPGVVGSAVSSGLGALANLPMRTSQQIEGAASIGAKSLGLDSASSYLDKLILAQNQDVQGVERTLPRRGNFADQAIEGAVNMIPNVAAAYVAGPGAFSASFAGQAAGDVYNQSLQQNPGNHQDAADKAIQAGLYTYLVARAMPTMGEAGAKTFAGRVLTSVANNAPQMLAQSAGMESIASGQPINAADWDKIITDAGANALVFAAGHGLMGGERSVPNGQARTSERPGNVEQAAPGVEMPPARGVEAPTIPMAGDAGAELPNAARANETQRGAAADVHDRALPPKQQGQPIPPEAQQLNRAPMQPWGRTSPGGYPIFESEAQAAEAARLSNENKSNRTGKVYSAELMGNGRFAVVPRTPPAEQAILAELSPEQQPQPPVNQPAQPPDQQQNRAADGHVEGVAVGVHGESVAAAGPAVHEFLEGIHSSDPKRSIDDADFAVSVLEEKLAKGKLKTREQVLAALDNEDWVGRLGTNTFRGLRDALIADPTGTIAELRSRVTKRQQPPAPSGKTAEASMEQQGRTPPAAGGELQSHPPQPSPAAESAVAEEGAGGTEPVKQVQAGAKASGEVQGKIHETPAEKNKPPTEPQPEPAPAPEPDGSITSIKNKQVDKERAARGLEPMMPIARRGNEEVWDAAMKKIDANPRVQDELIDSLKSNPRAHTRDEAALLLHRRVELSNEFHKVNDEINSLADRGEEVPPEMRQRLAGVSDRLLDLENITKRSGYETGGGLQARKMMAKEDYTLAAMETAKRAALGGKALSAEQKTLIADLHQKVADTQKAFDDYTKSQEERYAKLQSIVGHVGMVENSKRSAKAKTEVKYGQSNKIVSRETYKEALQKLRGGSTTFSITNILEEAVKVAAFHVEAGARQFGSFAARMVKDLGESIKPHLKDLHAKALAMVGPGRLVDKLKENAADKAVMGKYIKQMATEFVGQGIHDREKLIDAVHAEVVKAVPDMTRRETMDAISGYGDFKQLSKDEVATKLRDLKGQMQQLGKLEDMMQKGQAPLKTGVERREPSAEERQLIKQVNETKKKLGIQTTDPVTQLKSTLDGIKTRLKNQIEDLEFQINTGKKTDVVRTPGPRDAETATLETRRDELKKQYNELFGTTEMSGEQRVKLATAAIERSIKDLDAKLADAKKGIFEPDGKNQQPPTEVQSALKARRDAMREELQSLRDAANPGKTDEEIALQTFKTRTMNRIADLADKMAREDYQPKTPAKPLALDAEGQRLKAENERMKQQFQNSLLRDRLKNRTLGEKVQDWAAGLRRSFILSGVSTLAKLTSAASQRKIFTPLEELVGAGYSKLFKRLAAQAPREGGLSIKAEARAITQGFTEGMKDAWQMIKTGKSNLDVLYGKVDELPPSWLDFIGHIHGALKSTTKRNEFARSMQKRMEFAIRNGVDVNDPIVQTRIATDAYKDANRSIFMGDNLAVDIYKAAIRRAEQVNKETGHPRPAGKLAATALKIALPIVKVPTNVVAEAFQYATGSVVGGAKLLKAYASGIEKLTPDQSDLIMRQLKKGSLGGAVMLLGAFGANSIGGYYEPGQKRDEKDVKYGAVRVFGHDIPRVLLHNPLTEMLQLGATVRRVMDSRFKKSDPETQGLAPGIVAGAMGLAEETPFLGQTLSDLADLKDPRKRESVVGRQVKSLLVPAAVNDIAQFGDKNAQGEPIKRKPEGVTENIKMGIPGLRQQVAEVPQKLERMNTPSHRAHVAESQKDFGPLYGVPVEKALQLYEKMSDADKKKYGGPLKYKIQRSRLTPDEKTRLIDSIED